MAFPVFFDTCALYGAHLCDTFLRLANAGLYRPLWSADVLDELERNLTPRISEPAARRRIDQMQAAFPDAEVTGYRNLIDAMTCDPKDRHVLAAAVRANAELVVTFNLADFPADSTQPFDVEVVHPDAFLLDQLDLHPVATRAALHTQAAGYRKPSMTTDSLLSRLAAAGLPGFAGAAG